MARKKKELPLLENITITDVAAEGKAIARVDNLVVFVPYVVPGDVVDLQGPCASTNIRTSGPLPSARIMACVAAANGNAWLTPNN